ncbi:S1-like domain-containing RNA-binding protein [Atopobacter phocae]|uniref:S1-like domain-containing RNA-binding protein n=1 Tax=Atopobacter phocae TaxID=136492 RepID=UPI00046ECD5F|nr:S1-like domain-containing RNA-binding protein [Atopobacter phocae]
MIGTIVTALVIDINADNIFVQKEGRTMAVSKEDLKKADVKTINLGDTITGFVYEDRFGQMRLTPNLPNIINEQYEFVEVVKVRKDLGVFVDVGLEDKDIVVSMDDLPSEKHLWPKVGNKLCLTLYTDHKERMWGKLADHLIMQSKLVKAPADLFNKNVEAICFEVKLVGTRVLTTEGYLGFLHPNERIEEPTLGELISARVIDVKSDGTINISTKPRAHEAIGEDAEMILEMLRRMPGNQLPYHDKSDPEEIKSYFGISKGQFKRAIGHLLKARLIKKIDNGIELIK